MDSNYKELVNQLIILDETTDSEQGLLYLIKEKLKLYLNNYKIREAIKECNSKNNWTQPCRAPPEYWSSGYIGKLVELQRKS